MTHSDLLEKRDELIAAQADQVQAFIDEAEAKLQAARQIRGGQRTQILADLRRIMPAAFADYTVALEKPMELIGNHQFQREHDRVMQQDPYGNQSEQGMRTVGAEWVTFEELSTSMTGVAPGVQAFEQIAREVGARFLPEVNKSRDALTQGGIESVQVGFKGHLGAVFPAVMSSKLFMGLSGAARVLFYTENGPLPDSIPAGQHAIGLELQRGSRAGEFTKVLELYHPSKSRLRRGRRS